MSLGKKSLNDHKHLIYREEEHHERSGHSKKDTKHWCKGKFGKEHKLIVKSFAELKKATWLPGCYVQYCEECGKECAYYYPPIGGNMESDSNSNKPEWLVNHLKNG
jgi:hypothetical protein